MVSRVSSQIARNASLTLRSMVRSLLRNRFFASCWVIDGTALAHPAGLRVGDQRARGAGNVDAEMVVEAAVLGRQRRLDQIVRKILQRNGIIVLDAAAADRIAVAVEEGHREVGFLQPVFVGGFAERRHGKRQQQDQAAEPDGGGFRQRLDEDPALPAADIEAVHEGGVPLIELAQRPCRSRTASSRCARRNPASSAGFFSSIPLVRSCAPRPLVSSKALKRPAGHRRDVLRECCGKPKALLRRWGLTLYLAERGP